MNDLRYLMRMFQRRDALTPVERAAMIETIAATPSRMRSAVAGLSAKQLDTPYRDGGWTVRQVAHHVPDSHINAYIRTKFALTEDEPRIMAYDENAWAKLGDTRTAPLEISLDLLDAVHDRWLALLRTLTPEEFARTMLHPVNGRMTIDTIVANYAWHGPHHIAHITSLRERMGW